MIALIRVVKMMLCVLMIGLGVHLVNAGSEWNTEKIRTVVLTDVSEYVDGDNTIKARGKFRDDALKTVFQYPITHKLYEDFQHQGYQDIPMTVAMSRKEAGDPSYPKMQTEYIPGFLFLFGGIYFLWEAYGLAVYRNKPRRYPAIDVDFD